MDLKYSHIDILVADLDSAVAYFETVLGFTAGDVHVWDRDGLHVRFRVVSNPWQRFMLVQPLAGNLKETLDAKGEGTIYRFCFSTPDLAAAHRELADRGIHPIDENDKPISADDLSSPVGPSILWLPREIGDLSIEILEEPVEYPA